MIPRVYLEVTSQCNYRCVYCPHPTMQRPKRHIDWELATEALRQVRDGRIGERVWLNYLGEPLLYPQLFDLAQYATTLGLSTHVITNGSLLTDAMVTRLAQSTLSTIKVSHDSTFGDSAAAHGAPRFPPALVLEGIGRLLQAVEGSGKRVVVILMTTAPGFPGGIEGLDLISSPQALREEVAALLDEAGRRVQLPAHDFVWAKLDSLSWRTWNTELAISSTFSIEVRPALNWGNALTTRHVEPVRHGTCNALVEKVAILVNGDVVPCCVDAEGALVLGNVRERPLVEILASARARAMREGFAEGRVVEPFCQRCLGRVSAEQPAER